MDVTGVITDNLELVNNFEKNSTYTNRILYYIFMLPSVVFQYISVE
ncbi:Glycerophosphoryl diester phosphodiesterase [Enterococcus faecalis NY9]|nr:Glycerophosphoryl diester phosphodiesterase [Enterococcus faecalis NY9]